MTRAPRVVVIGAGASGLAMVAKLKAAGFDDVQVYEKAGDLGGTWRENTYPGVRCDVPSRLYCFSFALNPDWSQTYAAGAEIQAYLQRVADEHDLRRHIAFGTEVVECRWYEGRWRVTLGDGSTDTADVVVAATGILHQPHRPAIPGLEGFTGPVLHTAAWDHGCSLEGRRVAVVGTGSSGVQVTSALADVAGRLHVFQRTPQWILPLPNLASRPLGRWLRRHVPGLDRATHRCASWLLEHTLGAAVIEQDWRLRLVELAVRAHLRLAVRDPALRARLRPPDRPMCRRLIMSPTYYRALQRPHVEVVTDAIAEVGPTWVRSTDGTVREVDALVLATGFRPHRYFRPMRLIGVGGFDVEDLWREGPHAYRTVALPGFPGFFMLVGPHSPVGNHSVLAVAETQADHVVAWVRALAQGRWQSAAPTLAATRAYNERLRAALPGTVWMSGCTGWYLGEDGLPELYPWSAAHHRRLLAAIDEHELERWPGADDATGAPAGSPAGNAVEGETSLL